MPDGPPSPGRIDGGGRTDLRAGPRARVGCSGWQYREWAGRFYPAGLPARQWFASYATVFDTVELNTTFYRLPAATTVLAWRAAAPPGFCYALKVGSFGTHRRKLREPATWLARHVERAALLGQTLGPNVVQLPPRWRRNTERLEEFLSTARALAPSWRWAVELRDPTWVHDDTFEVLARHQSALVWHDLLAVPRELTTTWAYVRFHGPLAAEHPYRGRYGRRRLAPVAAHLRGVLGAGHDVYAYFNNDIGAHAPADARALRQLLAASDAATT